MKAQTAILRMLHRDSRAVRAKYRFDTIQPLVASRDQLILFCRLGEGFASGVPQQLTCCSSSPGGIETPGAIHADAGVTLALFGEQMFENNSASGNGGT